MDNDAIKDAFIQALQEQGLEPNEKTGLVMDGKMQRAHAIEGKKGNLDGSYTGYLDGMPAGYIKNFLSGVETKWKYGGKIVPLTVSQKKALAIEIEANKQKRQQERAAVYEKTAQSTARRWNNAKVIAHDESVSYLERKNVGAFGVRREGVNLLIPVRDIDGKLWSLQSVFPTKKTFPGGDMLDKVFAKDSKKEGNFHVLGEIRAGEPLLVGEGYATAASVHMATGQTTVVAFDSGNLDAVVGALKGRYPESPIIILGDDDLYNKLGNVGRIKAGAAAAKHGVGVVFPQFTTAAAQEKKFTDFNDLHVSEGLDAVKVQLDSYMQTHIKGNMMAHPSFKEKAPTFADHAAADRLTETKQVAEGKPAQWRPMAQRLTHADLTPEQNIEDEQRANGVSNRAHSWTTRKDHEKEMSNDNARKRVTSDVNALLNIVGKDAYRHAVLAMAISQRDIVPYREQFYKKMPDWAIEDAKALSPMSFDHKKIDAARALAAQQLQQRTAAAAVTAPVATAAVEQIPIPVPKPVNPLTAQEIFDISRAQQALEQSKTKTPSATAAVEENSIEAGPQRISTRANFFAQRTLQASASVITTQQAYDDGKRMNRIIGDASILLSGPRDSMNARDARFLAQQHAESLQKMHIDELRQRVIDQPMAMLAQSQPKYLAQLQEHAPEIAAMVTKSIGRGAPRTFDQQALGDVEIKRLADKQNAQQLLGLGNAQSVAPTPSVAPIPKMPEATPAQTTAHAGTIPVATALAMPENIKKKFIQVDNSYHFNDHTVAFVDHGKKLSTKSESHDVARDLVAIAKAREWDSIKIKGTEEFRRTTWMAASLENIQTTGYQPSEIELADLAKKMGNKVSFNKTLENSVEMGPKLEKTLVAPTAPVVQVAPGVPVVQTAIATPAQAQQTAAPQTPIAVPKSTGILIAHGEAPYLNDPKKGDSYYMTIETEKGPKTFWGKDLKRAIKEGNVDVGQSVLAEKVGQAAVTAKEKVFDANGNKIASRDVDAIKNQWHVGSVTKGMSFANGERADVLKAHPDLTPAYSMQAAAAQFAKQQFPHSQDDQARFTHGVKEATAAMITRGERLPVIERREVKEQGRDMVRVLDPKKQPEQDHGRV